MDNSGLTFGGERCPHNIEIIELNIGRIAPITRKSFGVSGRTGAIPNGYQVGVRPITAVVDFEADSKEEWLDKLDEITAWFTREDPEFLEFDQEPGRFYRAELEGAIETKEINTYGQAVLSFTCADPRVYKSESVDPFVDGIVNVFNAGTVPAEPKLYVEVDEPITYLDIWNNEGYMRIGKPATVDEVEVDKETILLNDSLSTTTGWTISDTNLDSGIAMGSIVANGYTFRAESFGTASDWHGPARKKTVPYAPVTDFTIEVQLIFLNKHSGTRGRLEWQLIDAQNNSIGKIAMKRVGGGANGNTVEIRIGGPTGKYLLVSAGLKGIEWLDFRGIIRLSRIGKVWKFYVAKVNPETGRHTARSSGTYEDIAQKYTGLLSAVQVHFGQSNSTETPDMFAGNVKVIRHNPEIPGVPVIARKDDIIEMDFSKGETLLNGEPLSFKRELAAQFFKVPPGESAVLLEPHQQLREATLTVRGRS